MKRISILGSTGSIGKNTLEVISNNRQRYKVMGLAAKNNVHLLESQIHEFSPEIVAVYDDAAAEELRKKKLAVEIVTGSSGLSAVATLEGVDTVVSAIVGSDGLIPTYEAIKAGKNLALATKEALVMAGKIIMAEASRRGVKIIPVDSEHSAVFQCLNGKNISEIERIILTASGGAFLKKKISDLDSVTPQDALKHPNWSMGRKITIDSATLMNKGLEVIEAHWLFDLPLEKIDVILHPQSIIHSMISFIDGSVMAHMSLPDMKGPISYALSYPERLNNVLPLLNFSQVKKLTFEEPDPKKFPALGLTYEAMKTGGTMPCVLNAANEVAVSAFLEEKIPFTDITRIVSRTMETHAVLAGQSFEEVLRVNDWAKETAHDLIEASY